MTQAPRLAYVINHAAFFASHRLPLALEAKKRGWEVHLVTGKAGSAAMEPAAERQVRDAGIVYHRVSFSSSSINPLTEASGLFALWMKLREIRPAIIHCASPKGTLYGGLAGRLAAVTGAVFSISGQGYIATGGGQAGRGRLILRGVSGLLARHAFAHRHKRVIVQNADDLQAALDRGLATEREIRLIPGSGVDLDMFVATPMDSKEKIVLFPARMLADKGLREFAIAARALKPRHPDWRFVLAGTGDYDNPTSVAVAEIEEWCRAGWVEWLGHVDAMADLYARSAICCLPSYREGMPKALLEAAAAGCAVVTTDAVGCREAIVAGQTGELTPIGDGVAVERAIEKLILDVDLRTRYGAAGRQLAEQRFSLRQVVTDTMSLYDQLLDDIELEKAA